MTTGQIVTLYPHKSAKQIWSLVEKESISDCRATTWTRVSVFIQSKEPRVIQPLPKWQQMLQKYLVIMRWHFFVHSLTIVRGTKEDAYIYYYMFLQRQPLRPWSLCRCVKDPVSEFDHYCWISCDEEYEEMRTERAVTRTEEQRMEFCRETTNDSKEEVRNAWNDGRSRRDPNFAPRK